MIDTVQKTIRELDLIAKGEAVLVALSGGPDSVALLHVLHQLAPRLGIRIGAAYVNHQIRVDEAAAEEEFCSSLCRQLEIDLVIIREDIPALAQEVKKGIEETARNFRYGALEQVAADGAYDKIAVGHHADDQVETILFRIIRGSGRRGLIGIPIRRDNIVRPLLEVTRQEIMEYLEQHGLSYCTDKTNEDLTIRRNFIRHRLLPLIREQINPRVDASLLNLAETMEHEEQYLESVVDRAMKKCVTYSPGGKIELALKLFCSYDKWLRRRLLRRCLITASTTDTFPDKMVVERLDTACLRGQKAISMPKRIRAIRAGEKMVLCVFKSDTSVEQLQRGRKVSVPGLQMSLDYRETNYRPSDSMWARRAGRVVLDAGKVVLPLTVRLPRPGDRFGPLGMEGTKTVNSFLADRKLHPAYRDEIPVVCDQRGIVWLVGYEIADRVKIDEKTRKVIKLGCNRRKTNRAPAV